MRQPGTGHCFNSLHQEAGISRLLKESSFAELMASEAASRKDLAPK